MKEQLESIEESALRIKNLMQIDLAGRFYPNSPEESLGKWLDQFSETFSRVISEKPELLTEYVENKEKALKEIELLVYKDEDLKKAA
jgi:hypothetical protein